MINNYKGVEDAEMFSLVVNQLRRFCLQQGFREVHTQDRLSILAACEDPDTVATYNYMGETWPLPQTGQMWLEYELLTNPGLAGVFTVSTSYRHEPNPVPGRHKLIFPLFEFEMPGTIEDLQKFETEMLEDLGFGDRSGYYYKTYNELAEYYGTSDLTYRQENAMETDFGPVVFCRDFPAHTSPFWNMKKGKGDRSRKIDVIVGGNETIGSAERSTNVAEMTKEFYAISGKKYAQKLFDLFGKGRVEKELNEFMSLNFFPRVGGAVGITRMIDAIKKREQRTSQPSPKQKPSRQTVGAALNGSAA